MYIVYIYMYIPEIHDTYIYIYIYIYIVRDVQFTCTKSCATGCLSSWSGCVSNARIWEANSAAYVSACLFDSGCAQCPQNKTKKKTLRLASTLDPGDGKGYLSPASRHYMNFFGDAPWELCGRETFEDFCPTPYTCMCF